MGAPEEADADEAEAPPTSDAPLESLLRRPSVAPTTGAYIMCRADDDNIDIDVVVP